MDTINQKNKIITQEIHNRIRENDKMIHKWTPFLHLEPPLEPRYLSKLQTQLDAYRAESAKAHFYKFNFDLFVDENKQSTDRACYFFKPVDKSKKIIQDFETFFLAYYPSAYFDQAPTVAKAACECVFVKTKDNLYNCVHCHTTKVIVEYVPHKTDARDNFEKFMQQYQGTHSHHVPESIYDQLKTRIRNCKLDIRTISKTDLYVFLKEINQTKHYENIYSIHHVLTGVPLDDIAHLSDVIMKDFDIIVATYGKIIKDKRKNFINRPFVLYQLLLRYRHPCKKEDFKLFKSVDRQQMYNEQLSQVFRYLGWDYTFV